MGALALAAALALATGCTSVSDTDDGLVVYAAASLEPVFQYVAEQYHSAHPESAEPTIVAGESEDLAARLIDGATADVIAFADAASVQQLADAGRAQVGEVFVHNRIEIAVAPGNPLGIADMADLSDLDVAVCSGDVPCGRATKTLLDAAGVDVEPVARDSSSPEVIERVVEGDVDAGLVFASDVVRVGGSVTSVRPKAVGVCDYPITVVTDSEHVEAARDFIELVRSREISLLLTSLGFTAEPS